MKNEPFKTCRLALTWLSIYPPKKTASKMQKFYYIVFSVFNFLLILLLFFACMYYFILNGLKNLERSLFALSESCACLPLAYMTATAFILRNKIKEILMELSKIFEASKFSITI